ncbi:MAG: metal-dependent hydrolase [Microbacterium sp.]|uniref:amidohydrolase n=1 Tax=unclassified Microbacterium TaxID=2609290 RepID=UPI000C5D47F3|nr:MULTISPECIES: amidohydrolase family protein [unclassified Microbacterium]MAY48414.1 metal-dependent hydrolase [Microbacterium sp.]HBR88124.1 metal-dependent hydrolase [Microbacterium sp.]
MTAVGDRVDTIVAARLSGPGSSLAPLGPVDVFLADGAIVDIAPAGAVRPVGRVLDAGGAWVIPGLWDHHVHVMQWALVAQRQHLDVATSAADAAQIMAWAPVLSDGRRVGTGFRDGLWGDAPTLELIDAATGAVPTYLINSDVHSVWMNSAAFEREGMRPDESGLVREEPAFEISRRLNDVDPAVGDAAVDAMAADAASRGVVGIVDLDMAWNASAWERRVAGGFDALRVDFGIYPEHLERAVGEGLRTGDELTGSGGLVRVGPLKVITDGSLGTRTAACSHHYTGEPGNVGALNYPPDEVLALMTRATGAGIDCAIHAIGDVANSAALDAFAASGARGTIEHAQLVAHADLARFARLGVAASVQPEHALDDRDMTDAMWRDQTALVYPLRSLSAAGANLRFGSDAPVARLDPWAAMASAVHRSRDGREAWRPDERVSAEIAMAASTRGGSTSPSMLQPGTVADLVVCDRDPATADEWELRATTVAATVLAGRVTHLA